jgi:hypothetical protein
MCLRAEATHPQMCGDGAVPSFCRTKGLRQEPEVGEHVVRANATHPKGVWQWQRSLHAPTQTPPQEGILGKCFGGARGRRKTRSALRGDRIVRGTSLT